MTPGSGKVTDEPPMQCPVRIRRRLDALRARCRWTVRRLFGHAVAFRPDAAETARFPSGFLEEALGRTVTQHIPGHRRRAPGVPRVLRHRRLEKFPPRGDR